MLAVLLLVPAAALWLRVNPGVLWSQRSRSLANDFSRDLLPPRLGPGGWSELVGSTIDTVALSLLALAISVVGGIGAAIVSRRRTEVALTAGPAQRVVAMVTRLLLLLARAVPPPIWAFLAVLIFFPGLWPGAIALAIYNLGVLGRLFADSFEDRDTLPTDQLLVTGAGPTSAFLYGALPTATPRLIALSLYRWEVIVRETVVVGVVGAGGLGQLINEHLAARDFAAVTGVIGALILLAFAADLIGAGCRRVFR